MAQTQQPMGSSPLAMANNMQGQVYRPAPPITGPVLGTPGNPMTPQMLQQLQAANPQMGQLGQKPMPQWGNLQDQFGAMGGAQTPQTGDRIAAMQRNLGAIQGMQPNQIPRMPGMQPPPGAPPPGVPGRGPGGAKAPGTPGGAQQMKQQMARLPGGPPPGAPATGPGAGKGAGQNPLQNPLMKQQIAQLPGAPR